VLDRDGLPNVYGAGGHGYRKVAAETPGDSEGDYRSGRVFQQYPGAQPRAFSGPEPGQSVKPRSLCRHSTVEHRDGHFFDGDVNLLLTKMRRLPWRWMRNRTDDNAMFRHKRVRRLTRLNEEEPLELRALEVRS